MPTVNKMLMLIMIVLYPQSVLSQNILSNEEVQRTIQSFIDSTDMPIKIDSKVTLASMNVFGTRGLQYNYIFDADRDMIDNNSQTINISMKSMKTLAINTLCNNTLMYWYKENSVSLRYVYYDNTGVKFHAFTVNRNDC